MLPHCTGTAKHKLRRRTGTWVWHVRLGGGFGDLGRTVGTVHESVEGRGNAPLLPQIEQCLRRVEVIVVQHQQRLRVYPAAEQVASSV